MAGGDVRRGVSSPLVGGVISCADPLPPAGVALDVPKVWLIVRPLCESSKSRRRVMGLSLGHSPGHLTGSLP